LIKSLRKIIKNCITRGVTLPPSTVQWDVYLSLT
jgi:hypothetical protein